MATAQAADWLSPADLREELRLAPGGEQDVMLARHIDAAVRWLERAAGLILLERTLKLSRAPVPMQSPFSLDRVPALAEVSQVLYWTAAPYSAAPTEDLARQRPGEAVGVMEPDVGWLEPVGGDDYRLWPRTEGWPPDAKRFQIVLKQGLNPTDHQDLAQALVMAARAYYGGEISMDQARLIDRTVAPYATTAYQPFTLGTAA